MQPELISQPKLNWQDMDYWVSGEWQVVEERLDDCDARKIRYNPSRINMFNSIDAVPMKDVKVVIVGQDPYPDPKFCTGFAFSIPKMHKEIPATLRNIYQEYCNDLHYPTPTTGNLEPWVNQGVLLWNAIPTCEAWKSLSHDWDEYRLLTKDILSNLSILGNVVFVLLGSIAKRYTKDIHCVDPYNEVSLEYLKKDTKDITSLPKISIDTKDILKKNYVIETAHPSPRAGLLPKTPFAGSRLFTTINTHLCSLEKEPINWRL